MRVHGRTTCQHGIVDERHQHIQDFQSTHYCVTPSDGWPIFFFFFFFLRLFLGTGLSGGAGGPSKLRTDAPVPYFSG